MNPTLASLRTAIKRCTRFYIHAERDLRAPSYSDAAIFHLTCVRVTFNRGSERQEITTRVDVPGRITHGYTSRVEMIEPARSSFGSYAPYPKYADAYRVENGYWGIECDEIFRSAVLSLPARCEPSFCISLDGGTSECLIKVGIHSDRLYLEGRTERGAVRRFLLDTNNGPHNTARFGAPKHENDQGAYQAWVSRKTA